MGLDQSGVLTVGTLVPKEGGHTLPHKTLLVIPPWSRKPPPIVRSPGHYIRAVPMQHMVNKAHTRWVAANLIRGHLAYAGNHRHGAAGHSQGWCSAQKAVIWAKQMAFGQGVVVTGGYRSCPAIQCGATVTTALTDLCRHIFTRVLTTPGPLEDLEGQKTVNR